MRIGIDGRELINQRTGVGRYLSALCAEWLKSSNQLHEFFLYTPQKTDSIAELGPPFDSAPSKVFTHKTVEGSANSWWEQIALPRLVMADNVDVFFAPSYSAPLRLKTPYVVTMHDISFSAHPEWFRWREGLRRRWLADWSMKQAASIITVSNFSKNEIMRLFDISEDRIHVIPHGIDTTLQKNDSERENLVLYVGSIFNRRHLPTLIHAFSKVVPEIKNVKLAIVGANRTYPWQDLNAMIVKHNIEQHVQLDAYVSDSALRALYERAKVFVFLSEYEGFGLPPLEALTAGVPTIVGDSSVAREIYGNASLFVSPRDINAVTTAMINLLTDDPLRKRQTLNAASLLKSFNWATAAADTLELLERTSQINK
tara:strand:- start:4835 stop:5944 length:1110 start_codon:yes stop_codon:yes gene_type:complete